MGGEVNGQWTRKMDSGEGKVKKNHSEENLKRIAEKIFTSAVAEVDPKRCIDKVLTVDADTLTVGRSTCRLDEIGHLYLIGIGKASAAMAFAVETRLGDRIEDGVVVTKYDHGMPLTRCRLIEAGHPIPDENGMKASDAILDLVRRAGPDDLILCLISGGGSALSPAPAEGISLEDKQETTRLLLSCGATIHEINTIRKHLSRIKGGQLCRNANGARIISMILSDVIGDDLDMIASGMTAPDPTDYRRCKAIFSQYRLWDGLPKSVQRHMTAGIEGRIPDTPKPESPDFDRVENHIVGSLSDALNAAATAAQSQGFNPLILSSTIQGEALEVAKVIASIGKEVSRSGHPIPAPACILSGGETTVTLKGEGIGGRNMELALAAAIELSGASNTVLLSAGTDGTDGPTDAAGAFATGSTLSRAHEMGISARDFLQNNDSYRLFKPLNDLLITGPTRTNVMDLQILLVARF